MAKSAAKKSATREYSAAEKMMIKDGFPAALFFTAEERRKWWEAHPPKSMRVEVNPKRGEYPEHWYNDPSFVKYLAELEAEKKQKAEAAAQRRTVKRREDGGPAVLFPDDAVIEVLIDKNPKKEGSAAHARWSLLMSHHGSTVRMYVEQGGNPTTLKNAVNQKRARVR